REVLFFRIADVDAVGAVVVGGDPEESVQAHHVVDAQHAGRLHLMAHTLDEIAVALLARDVRQDRREAPILAAGETRIGWRADGSSSGEQCWIPPGVKAIRADPYGQIEVESNAVGGRLVLELLHLEME